MPEEVVRNTSSSGGIAMKYRFIHSATSHAAWWNFWNLILELFQFCSETSVPLDQSDHESSYPGHHHIAQFLHVVFVHRGNDDATLPQGCSQIRYQTGNTYGRLTVLEIQRFRCFHELCFETPRLGICLLSDFVISELSRSSWFRLQFTE